MLRVPVISHPPRFAGGRRCACRPAALLRGAYALLAAFVAPALVPGRTLRPPTDLLWSIAPWTAERPDGVRDLGAN